MNTPYPHLSELRRIRISSHNEGVFVVSWALMLKRSEMQQARFSGFIVGSFIHKLDFTRAMLENFNESYKTVSKRWKRQGQVRHDKIKQFCLKWKADPDYPLDKVSKHLRIIPMDPKMSRFSGN